MTQVPTIDEFQAMGRVIEDLKMRLQRLESRPNPLKWLPVSVACQALDMSESHVRKLVKQGILKSTREGKKVLIDMESLQAKQELGKGKRPKRIDPIVTPVQWEAKRGRPAKQ